MIRSRTGVILFISGILFTLVLTVSTYLVLSLTVYKNSKLAFVTVKQSTTGKAQEKKALLKVLTVTQSIGKDEEITDAKIKYSEISADATPSNAVMNTEALKGEKTAVALEPNTILTKSMLYSTSQELNETDRLRDYEMPGGLVGGTASEGTYIDVEYVNPHGDTYVVLAKKLIKKTLENSRIILQLSSDERKLINYAMAEQKALGGRLDVIAYVDERQPASKVNYPVPNLNMNQQQTIAPQLNSPIIPSGSQPQPVPSGAVKP